jgi:hypothetical protein
MRVPYRGPVAPRRGARRSLLFALASASCVALLVWNGSGPQLAPTAAGDFSSSSGGAAARPNVGQPAEWKLQQARHRELDRVKQEDTLRRQRQKTQSQLPATTSSLFSQQMRSSHSQPGSSRQQKNDARNNGKSADHHQQQQQQQQPRRRSRRPRGASSIVYDFPIIMMTHKRAGYLALALDSLLAVRGIDRSRVYVFQDGAHPEVGKVARARDLRILQRKHRAKHKVEPAVHIAATYKWALGTFFAEVEPRAKWAVIVEEDQLFAPDFLEYFDATGPVLLEDKSLLAVSSYNDNGFSYMVSDPTAVRRTEFFIGLGWLLTRRLWEKELKPRWPATHWDHWVRSAVSRGRETVYPEISRSYHFGIRGAHANVEMFRRYFENIELHNDDGVYYNDADGAAGADGADGGDDSASLLASAAGLHKKAYEARIRSDLARGVFDETWSKNTIANWPPNRDEASATAAPVAIFLYRATSPSDRIWEHRVARVFGMWHSIPIRGMHRGLIEFKWNGWHVMLVATYSPYAKIITEGGGQGGGKGEGEGNRAPRSPRHSFDGLTAVVRAPPARRREFAPIVGKCGESCDAACARRSLDCSVEHFAEVNNCDALETAFPRHPGPCKVTKGFDLPARICGPKSSPRFNERLVWKRRSNEEPFYPTCGASHATTARLCPCVRRVIGTGSYSSSVTYRGAGERG